MEPLGEHPDRERPAELHDDRDGDILHPRGSAR